MKIIYKDQKKDSVFLVKMKSTGLEICRKKEMKYPKKREYFYSFLKYREIK